MINARTIWLNMLAVLREGFTAVSVDKHPVEVRSERKIMATDRRRLLKIKLKSLGAEAAIIRKEEMKAKFSKRPEVMQLREEMHQHRVRDLRAETRATLLAYSYIRGRTYRQIEPRSNVRYAGGPFREQWNERVRRVVSMVAKYGGGAGSDEASIWTWLQAEAERPIVPRPPKKPYTGEGVPGINRVTIASVPQEDGGHVVTQQYQRGTKVKEMKGTDGQK